MFEKWPQKWGSQQMDFEVFPNIKVVEQNSGVKPDLVETLLVGHFWSDQIWSSIFGRAHIWSNPYLFQTHIWSEPFLVQPNLVGAIFGPTRFGRCHIWSIQIWLVYT